MDRHRPQAKAARSCDRLADGFSSQNLHLTLLVAVLTRRRPHMLVALMHSLAKLQLPDNCSVSYLVVENDTEQRVLDAVQAVAPLFPAPPLYVHEDEPGIPFGRNRAVREAIARDCDLLLFVDDDEEVAEDWLVHMVAAYRTTGAVLLGGPLRAQAPKSKLSLAQRKMFENIQAFTKPRKTEPIGTVKTATAAKFAL